MTDKYCPRNEIKKLEAELWNLKVKGTDVTGVVASKPKTMQEATEMVTELMDKKISTFAERQAENKRKLDNNNFLRGRMWLKFMPLGLVKRRRKDHVMLRVVTLKPVIKKQLSSYIKAVSPWKGVVRFGKRGKLNPRDAGPFQALAKVEAHAYKLSCLEIVPIDGLHIGAKLQIVEEPIEITNREVKWLKQSCFPIVKVRWNSRRGPEFIWEREDRFQKKYPHLFTNRASSSNATSLSLEDKAHLTRGDYNTPCFRVLDVVNKSAMYLLVLLKIKKDKARNHKKGLKNMLAEIDSSLDKGEATSETLEERMNIMNKLTTLEKIESFELAQKAKVKWSIEGDENSKYFHGITNKQRNNIAIRGILVDDTWIEDPKVVKNEFHSHFKDRFNIPCASRFTLDMDFPSSCPYNK
ncbi:hypothetical protein Tco_0596481 [Tanacetum coccineum]